jgi:hypothetical protein
VRHRLSVLAASAALATAATLGLTAAPAMANAGAPQCDSGARQFICTGDSLPGGPYTWTVSWIELGNPFSYQQTTSGIDLFNTCDAGYHYSVSYSYTQDGTVVNSDTGGFLCNAGDWP